MAFHENFDRETVSDISKVGPNILKDDLDTPKNNFSIDDADTQNDENEEIKDKDAGIVCAAQIGINFE